MNYKYDLNDISLVPAVQSDIITRKSIDTKQVINGQKYLPIIVSPMDTVIDEKNYNLYLENNLMVCIPRGLNLDKSKIVDRHKESAFFSYSMTDFKDLLDQRHDFPNAVLVDLANGHISIISDLIKIFKALNPKKKIMVGNIANPETYRVLSLAGADYIRVGIGVGSACLTSVHTSIHYPMASLLIECRKIQTDLKIQSKNHAKIVGDGGFREYSDIIKGLALGADFIMCGSALNKCLESSGDMYFCGFKVSNKLGTFLYSKGFKVFKKFRGMSTKEVQKKWNKKELRASEGIVTKQEIRYDLRGWVRNLDDYLRSSMSYCNKDNILSFIGKVEFIYITQNAYNRFIK